MPRRGKTVLGRRARLIRLITNVPVSGSHVERSNLLGTVTCTADQVSPIQLAYALSFIGIAAMRGSSVEAAGEYVAPEQVTPRGKAPKMHVELLNPGEPTKLSR
jgi:hypothetical protein